MVFQDAVEHARAAFEGARVDLDGLCALMAIFGARYLNLPPSEHAPDPEVGAEWILDAIGHEFQLWVEPPEEMTPLEDVSLEEAASRPTTEGSSGGIGSATMMALEGAFSSAFDEDSVTVEDEVEPPTDDPASLVAGTSGGWVNSKKRRRKQRETPQTLSEYCARLQIQPQVHVVKPPEETEGRYDGRYIPGEALGAGGAGIVQRVYDHGLRRWVALKILQEDLLEHPMMAQAFIEEAMITGGLEHPSIVPVYELGFSANLGPYYTMKCLEGQALSAILKALREGHRATERRFGLFRLLGCFAEVCRAIAYAHDQGVVHSDLKPDNILVGNYGEVTVVDWGLARVLGQGGMDQARAQMRSGTPEYMAPEQVTGTITDLDPQSDVWAMGVILYELLTLEVPFRGADVEALLGALVRGPITPPSQRAPHRYLPAELERICMLALSRDKGTRFASVRDLLAALEAYLDGTLEARRQAEAVQGLRLEARRRLAVLDAQEREHDRLQTLRMHSPRKGRAALSISMHRVRVALLEGYQSAREPLLEGLTLVADDVDLLAMAGDLYWRIFRRVYPTTLEAVEEFQAPAMALLSVLTQRASSAVLNAGRDALLQDGAAQDLAELEGDDLWLAIVDRIASPQGRSGPEQPVAGLAELVERITFLRNVSLFEGMESFALMPIAEACAEDAFEADGVIFHEGDPGDALFVIMSGRVDIRRGELHLVTLKPGDCFGEIAVLDASTRTASAVCPTRCRCLRLTAECFNDIVLGHGEIGLSVMRVLTMRLRKATQREAEARRGE